MRNLLLASLVISAATVAGCSTSFDDNLGKDTDGGGGGKHPDLKSSADLAGGDPQTDVDMTTPTNPEITTLRVHYPKGTHSLAIRGDKAGLTWDSGIAATASGTDLFEYTVTIPAGETLEWKPLLDDKDWSHGPNYKATRGQTLDIYPHFFTSAGRIDKPADLDNYKPDSLAARDVWVYLPASYDENPTAKYPVLYMHDGTNLFDAGMSFGGVEWQADEAMDSAVEGNGSIREIIIVGVFATNDRMEEYTPTFDDSEGFGGNGDAYLKLLVEKLKPTIDGKYRTLSDRANTGIMGSSLGGLISVYAGIKYPEVFGIVGAMSPSTWWDETYIIGAVQGIDMTKPHPLRVYVDSGTPSDDSKNTAKLADAWKALGYQEGKDFHYYTEAGAHSEVYWQKRLPGALSFLFGARTP